MNNDSVKLDTLNPCDTVALRTALNKHTLKTTKRFTVEDRKRIRDILGNGTYTDCPIDVQNAIDENPCRYVAVSDGCGMGDSVYVFITNIPAETLKAFERFCQELSKIGYESDEMPNWAKTLDNDFDHVFEYVSDHQHVSPYGTSSDWLEDRFPEINEYYKLYYEKE